MAGKTKKYDAASVFKRKDSIRTAAICPKLFACKVHSRRTSRISMFFAEIKKQRIHVEFGFAAGEGEK